MLSQTGQIQQRGDEASEETQSSEGRSRGFELVLEHNQEDTPINDTLANMQTIADARGVLLASVADVWWDI